MILVRAVESVSGLGLGQAASEKLANYASILASQGKLNAAMQYLPEQSDKVRKPRQCYARFFYNKILCIFGQWLTVLVNILWFQKQAFKNDGLW